MGGGGFLGLGPAPSAPAAPDYTGAAQATAAGNLQAAQTATAANRVNQVTPYGNLNYAETGTDSQGNPTWTATTSLSNVGQQLLDTQNNASLGLGGAINAQLGQVQNVMSGGFNPQTGPITTNVGQANINPLTGQANLQTIGQGPTMNGVGGAQQAQGMGNAAQLQTGLENQGMAGWDKASQLMMQRLQPQMEIQQKNLDAQLANQGLAAGTEAYGRAKMSLGMQQNDLLNQAQLSAQGIGQNLFNQSLQGGQFTNAALTQQNQNQLANTGLSNQAAQQNYSNLLSGQGFNNTAQQQQYANQLAQQAANNPALQQMYTNQQAQQQGNNALAQQQFGNQMANANLGNQAQQQQYTQAMTNYNMPLNTLSALRTGAQVQNPTFQNVPQQATTAGADLLGATTAAGNYNLGTYNAQQAAQSGLNSGLMGLGGTLGAAALMAPASDIRMKENIEQVGKLANGLNVYTYEYKPEFRDDPFAGHGKHIGVMAQEVEEIMPEAVITRPDGYKMVNYGALNA